MFKLLLILLITCTFTYGRDKDSDDVKKADTSYTFDNVTVYGYEDNPTPFYILDADDGENTMVDLERSFMNALQHNVDKEQVSRTLP